MSAEGTLTREGFEQAARLIATSAYVAYTLALKGHSNPSCEHYANVANAPQIGDFVTETSTLGRALRDGHSLVSHVGRVRRIVHSEHVVIETLDGRYYEWTNASFVVVPDDLWHGRWHHET